jgi:hypothetical protein
VGEESEVRWRCSEDASLLSYEVLNSRSQLSETRLDIASMIFPTKTNCPTSTLTLNESCRS